MNAAEVAHLLRCPLCAGSLTADGGTLRCPNGHAFDIGRGGTVTLAGGGGLPEGDTAEMLDARARFLDAGSYGPIVEAITDAPVAAPGVVLDAGTGTGWYLARILESAPGAVGLAVDTSAPAVRQAARAHERAAGIRCDLWTGLPVADGVVDVVLDVFSPRNGAEFARVLAPGGVVFAVTPTERHLAELRAEIGLIAVDPDKRERLEASMQPLRLVASRPVEWTLTLPGEAVRDLVAMGPNARHGIVARDEPRAVTASVEVSVFRH